MEAGSWLRSATGSGSSETTKDTDKMKTGMELIAAERERQVTAEGWTPEHDSTHERGELTEAACCYAQAAVGLVLGECIENIRQVLESDHTQAMWWPWDEEWWKPSDDPVRNLVKAGALIAAEIDRINGQNKLL